MTAAPAPIQTEAARRDIDHGVRVLEIEARAVAALAASLGDDFAAAVETLYAIKGRVIITGMGKSGHVARKIAATMASVGTPSHFVHPAEASHGDLGMVTEADAVIALSNSGETAELADIIAYTRRFNIPLIAITSRAGSTLDTRADITLLLPPEPEACPMGLAPTTSTTLMLALGDALAVALLERLGFTSTDFRTFHPGGKLGKSLMLVKDLMHGATELPLVKPEASLEQVLATMSAGGFGCAGVIDENGLLTGIVTDGDLRRHILTSRKPGGAFAENAAELMTVNPKTVTPGQIAGEALAVMDRHKIASLFVVASAEDRRPIGLLQTYDCLRAGLA
ncbi:KpsF/GutQ family sugar-phosphate isomerase [Radicibacter daui]|uniref:KpsF/GutQ family sugar-phosphate isomerase n=1 Tax=Radicibacter daui TaxID=3064829 RepID=UPI004047018C